MRPINLQTLLDQCLKQIVGEAESKNPQLNIRVVKEYDRSASMLHALPEDLIYAFLHLLNNAAASLIKKRKLIGLGFDPELKIKTVNRSDTIEIQIRDNGIGIPKVQLDRLLKSFTHTQSLEESEGFGLSIAYDIIVLVHHGEIKINSSEGEFFQITVILPKTPQKKKTLAAVN